MLEYQPSMNDQGVSAVNGVNSEDRIRVQCLAAEIEILKRTISDLKFQLQAVQSVTDLADSLEKAACDALTNQSEFEWVQPVNMYFHHSTGFYYDDASCLFYNPSKGCYLKYNPRTLQYVEIGNPTPETKSEEMSRSEVAVDTESPRISEHGIKTEPQEFINYSEGSSIVSGYMYDKASGYYYNTETLMFFEPHSRRYFKYDAATQTHMEVSEDGQPLMRKCSLGNSCIDITDSCVRLIVIQSQFDELSRGTLFIVTKNESKPWIGTDKSCVVVIPENDNSKVKRFHCKMKLNEDEKSWQIRTGESTYEAAVNGKELSSDCVHIHSGDGNDTCDGCEPALVQAFYNRISGKRKSEEEKDGTKDAEKELTVEQKRRLINKMMKQEMGLQTNGSTFSNGGDYKDRAAERRRDVGSEPSIGYSVGSEYPFSLSYSGGNQSSSVDMPVRRDNIGYKLLAKMGYREGEGLGASGQGIVEPVRMEIREHRAGLSETQPKFALDEQEKAEKYKRQWSKAAQRFAELS